MARANSSGASSVEAMDIVLVTCERWPELSAGDRPLSDELNGLGHRVRVCPWNAAPIEEFTSADLVVLRSNWDYHHDLDRFSHWLDQVEASAAELQNPPDLIRAFLDKSYLKQVQAAGFRTPVTFISGKPHTDGEALSRWADGHRFERVVVKPAWGPVATASNWLTGVGLVACATGWSDLHGERPMLVQEFIPAIADGEYALVYFRGEFSHALLRSPAPGDFRVNGQYGGSMRLAEQVSQAMIEFGAKVVAALPEPTVYARIDLVGSGADLVVMEVEINEPGIGLDQAPGSGARFARALLQEPNRADR